MLGRALKAMRQFHNQSQGALANTLGISNSYLSEIESGKKEPTLEILNRYSTVFNVPLSSILAFSETLDGSQSVSKVKSFVAKKMLKVLEWISENGEISNDKKAVHEK
ncbi:helix-turn-helix transcriptional regulator [Burkholderia multivorans]|uniref:XRE family transcriptional regulator n=2 Tax=root TaxID=1 RepID=A0A0H3KK19_BURM1|nr:helix-turn-helix transcriptional regulator [Burkholderia multivorans]YP_004306412.1 transcriptional regulator [Burkholderia phage KS5]ABX18503.1 transcriptional regulator, XRE family [Burkholderia multivorans ATCC 17616]ADP02292.1 gp45 [Burkholderia phage KS5]MBU9461305.1 helix-turn-helix domain-containing protein [Burkholderia multivorans]MBU9483078.1 helix-turn-helix domain-containing protein [Burkholderia multivorans]MBU9512208.1 helix-turn-helix domain-containing protein [Burkholderia 